MPDEPIAQQYPHIGINVASDGMTISIFLAPGTIISQSLNEEAMNAICKKWLETRQEVKKHLALIRDIQRSKNN